MPKYTTPKNLWDIIRGLQSVGGTQYEGSRFINETLRYVNAKQGIDVEYKNRLYGDGVDADGIEQLETPPLPISQQSGDVVEDRDKRKSLGTFPISNRGFWEDINFNPATLQPYLTSDLRKTVKTRIVSIPDGNGSMVYKDINLPDQIDRDYSIDALPFVTDPNNENEIIRVDRYYDKEINSNEYNLATEGKINYYLYPRTSGRLEPNFALDVYKSRNRKASSDNINRFDKAASNRIEMKGEGYFLFNLDWGDNTQKEYTDKPKLLEGSVIFDHTYEKPGFYTITGTVFLSYGFFVRQYERFETRILLNPSKKKEEELNLLRYKNFATIGGISMESSLVKSVSSMLGIDPFDLDDDRADISILKNYNDLDNIQLLNFMNMVSSNTINKYKEKYIDPYSKIINDEPTPVLEIPIIKGCLDPNADNTTEYATVNHGCEYSYLITSNISGLGGQSPLFFVGEYDEFRNYYLAGGAYADWNNVITQLSSDDLLEEVPRLQGTLTPRGSATEWTISGVNNSILKNLLSTGMSMALKNPLTDESLESVIITNLGVNDGVGIYPAPTSDTGLPIMSLSFTVSDDSFPRTGGKFALIVAPSSIYPSLGYSDDVPFDGWTIPDGLRIGKVNYSDEGTPIINQTSGNDLPGTLSGQGFGYQINTPIDLYGDVDGTDRVYILTADPDNPPSETNYTDKEILANWSGDVEDTGDLGSNLGSTLFYATVETEVISGDGTITYLELTASGQDGVLAGDTIIFEITPSANQNINHLYYNGEEVLPGDDRIVEAYNLSSNTNMPTNAFYETSSTTGLDMWGEDVRYTFEVIAETDNRVEAIFSVMTVSDELFGNDYVSYDTIRIVVFNSPGTSGTGPSGVRFLPTLGLSLVQAGQGLPSSNQGSYAYNYEVPNQYNNMVNYNPNYDSNDGEYVLTDHQPINSGPYEVKFDRDFMNMLNEDENTDEGFGYTWMGWFSKSPNDPQFDVEADLLSTADEYEFYTVYNEGEGSNNEEQYFPTLIENFGNGNYTFPVLAVYAYVKYTSEMDGEGRIGP